MSDKETVGVHVRLSKDMITQIDELLNTKESNRSQIIREATKKGLPLMK